MSLASGAAPSLPGTNVSRLASTVGWGCYCASSWTWCIGMFLPIILLARFGWPGFWAFLIPNVLGCAAFGYIFDAESSRRFATDHARAIRWFAAATIAFQVFFLGWSSGTFIYGPEASMAGDAAMVGTMTDSMVWPVLGTMLTWSVGAVALASRGDSFWRWFGVASIGVGLVLLGLVIDRADGLPTTAPRETGLSVAAAAPIIALGFICCPALDPTFHRARQQAPSRHAFAVFGVAFAAMLVLAAWVFESPFGIAAALLPFVVTQWTVQIVFTIGAHVREIKLLPGALLGPGPMVLGAILVGAAAGLPALASEATYMGFLGLYAVPFPNYVVAAAVAGRGRLEPGSGWLTLVVSGIAAPFAWLGFVDERTILLLPAAAIVAIGGWLIGRRSRQCRLRRADSGAEAAPSA